MFRKLWEWLRHPHGWALVLFYIFAAICIAGAIAFTVIDIGYDVLAYVFYALAAVALAYTVYTLVLFIPRCKQNIVALIRKNGFTNKMYEQYGFRTVVFALVSLTLSLANALLNGVTGIVYLSLWYIALGAYYLLLFVMRGGVLLSHRKKGKAAKTETPTQIKVREFKAYRVCGILLVLLPLALSFAILEMIVSDRAFVRAGMMIYVTALYTCYKVTMAIRNIFKARKNDDATVQAIRNVNLADALVSVLALQTAMFHEFAGGESIGYANAITGAVVCALTAALGIFMIVKGSACVKKLQTEKDDGSVGGPVTESEVRTENGEKENER